MFPDASSFQSEAEALCATARWCYARGWVPATANTQNYENLAGDLGAALRTFPQAHGVLLSRHGLYTWGTSVAEARRHLEALEFLFEVEGRRLMGGLD